MICCPPVMTLLWDPPANTPPSRRCCGVTPSLTLSGQRNFSLLRAWVMVPLSRSWSACCPYWAWKTEDSSSSTSSSDSCRLRCVLDLPTPRYWPRRITAPFQKRRIASSWLPGALVSRRLSWTHQWLPPLAHRYSTGPPTHPRWLGLLYGGNVEKGFVFIISVLERRHGTVCCLAILRPRETGPPVLCSSHDGNKEKLLFMEDSSEVWTRVT